MTIKNPGVLLPLIFFVLLVALVFCVYLLFRMLRPKSRGDGGNRLVVDMQASTDFGDASAQRSPAGYQERTLDSAQTSFEVFRVMREGPTAQLVVIVDGQRYQRLSDIRDRAASRRVLEAIQDLAEFTPPRPELAAAELRTPITEELAVMEGEKGKVPGDGLVGFWKRGASRRGPTGKKERSFPSMIEQIEDLLQRRLEDYPAMVGREIHFGSTPGGDLRIEVDGQFFQSLDEIPDMQVRVLLRDTIKIWEMQ